MIFVALLYGVMLFVIGIAATFHTTALLPSMQYIMKDQAARLGVVYLFLPMGLAGVYFHNDWSWGPGLAITLIAWLICVRMAALLLLPTVMIDRVIHWVFAKLPLSPLLRLSGIMMLIFGALAFWQVTILQRPIPIYY